MKIIFLATALLAGCAQEPSASFKKDERVSPFIGDAHVQETETSANNLVTLTDSTYRFCDGKSGRMVFIYSNYKQGGIHVLTGQGDCR